MSLVQHVFSRFARWAQKPNPGVFDGDCEVDDALFSSFHISPSQIEGVREMLEHDAPVNAIAKVIGLPRQVVYRIQDDPTWAERLLS